MSAQAGTLKSRIFSFTCEEVNGATLVVCRGKLLLEITGAFKTEIKALFAEDKRVILDLHQVTHIDSSGIGALVQLYVSSKTSGCKLQLYHLSEPVSRSLGLTKVLDAFASCGSYLTRLP